MIQGRRAARLPLATIFRRYAAVEQRNPTLASAVARNQHSNLEGKDYMRNMQSRRQLQGFVMLRRWWRRRAVS
jgi:hypothetical protein